MVELLTNQRVKQRMPELVKIVYKKKKTSPTLLICIVFFVKIFVKIFDQMQNAST